MMEEHFRYQLANTAGYKFNICKIGVNNQNPLAYQYKENFPDIEITRPNVPTALELLHTKCLVSVNGYIYPTQYTDGRLFIPNATTSMLRSKINHIGILSFNKLANPTTKLPIDITMVTSEAPYTLYEKAIITFNQPISKPILIMCGYMIFEDPEFFYRVSDRSFVLRLDRLNYVEKLYELNRYRDIFNELNIPISVNNPSVYDTSISLSNTTITSFLTGFNSFLVNLPINNLTLTKIYLEHSTVPGNFRTEIEPTMPILVGYGKIGEYFKKKNNDTKWTTYIKDAYYNQHLISNMSFTNIRLQNDHRIIGNNYRLSRAYFLRMSTGLN